MLNASIVLYKNTFSEISLLINILINSKVISEIFLVDNSPIPNPEFDPLNVTYIFNNHNIGYGCAHNIAIRKTLEQKIPYHLVINPDISFDASILNKIENYMTDNLEVGHLMPKVFYPNGNIQYLCKLLPTPFDLIFRRFLPKSWTKKQTAKFELRNSGYDKIIDVPYLSGCFMFLRTTALEEVGLFDERFFMYPEDIDLTRRLHQKYKTIFYPGVSIVHNHAQASYQNVRLLWVHLWNMTKYFNKWGWFYDSERKKVNQDTLRKLNLL